MGRGAWSWASGLLAFLFSLAVYGCVRQSEPQRPCAGCPAAIDGGHHPLFTEGSEGGCRRGGLLGPGLSGSGRAGLRGRRLRQGLPLLRLRQPLGPVLRRPASQRPCRPGSDSILRCITFGQTSV